MRRLPFQETELTRDKWFRSTRSFCFQKGKRKKRNHATENEGVAHPEQEGGFGQGLVIIDKTASEAKKTVVLIENRCKYLKTIKRKQQQESKSL